MFERERILSALETSVLCAEKLYPDMSETIRATQTRNFFLQLLHMGEKQNIGIDLPDIQNISINLPASHIASEETKDRVF
jgi:hypothetical protein